MSVPIPMSAIPSATATADPELLPPEINSSSQAQRTAPYGLRVPTSPVANWSRLVFPRTTAPCSINRATALAVSPGEYANSGHAAVVGRPATSTLSLTATRRPARGRCSPAAILASTEAASASTSSLRRNVIQTSGRSTSSIRWNACSTRAVGVKTSAAMVMVCTAPISP